jgi:hypothetical protein
MNPPSLFLASILSLLSVVGIRFPPFRAETQNSSTFDPTAIQFHFQGVARLQYCHRHKRIISCFKAALGWGWERWQGRNMGRWKTKLAELMTCQPTLALVEGVKTNIGVTGFLSFFLLRILFRTSRVLAFLHMTAARAFQLGAGFNSALLFDPIFHHPVRDPTLRVLLYFHALDFSNGLT